LRPISADARLLESTGEGPRVRKIYDDPLRSLRGFDHGRPRIAATRLDAPVADAASRKGRA
jgi:hypothetical protein